MVLCAYCDTECVPTREHVIPDWYGSGRAKDGWQVFNARRPTTHLEGQVEIKDVCEHCNNVRLGNLDGYAKGIYDKYLNLPASYGESSDLEIDRSQFIRWLAKVCYNSARVHNADVTILRKYRRFMLGLDAAPEPIVYVHLVTASDFTTSPPSAARRIIGGHPQIKPARWFKVSQVRADSDFMTTIVQRQIYIDSYCFTLFAVDPEVNRHSEELERLESKFKQVFPSAQLIPPNGKLTMVARDIHVAAVAMGHIESYPARYGDGPPSESLEFSEMIGGLVDRTKKVVFLAFTREEVDAGDISGMVDRLNELVATCESAMASKQRIVLMTCDYDDDPREVWDIPEVCKFLQRLFLACPFIFFLALPGSLTIDMLMCCCCRRIKKRDNGGIEFDLDDVKNFLNTGFDGMNRVTQRHAISAEINNAITDDVLAIIFGKSKPMDQADIARRLSRG